MSFFLSPSHFLTILHHYTHPDPILTTTRGDSKKSEEIQALRKSS